jgi:hypothetical protein
MKVKASLGRFAVFHVRKEDPNSFDKPKTLPILYSKNPEDIEAANPLKMLLKNEDPEKQHFYMNKICDRVINNRQYFNQELHHQEELNFENSNFVDFEFNEVVKASENELTKE